MNSPLRCGGDGASDGAVPDLFRVVRCPTIGYEEVPYPGEGLAIRIWPKAVFERIPPHLQPDEAVERCGVYVLLVRRG